MASRPAMSPPVRIPHFGRSPSPIEPHGINPHMMIRPRPMPGQWTSLQLCVPFSGGFQRRDAMEISYLVSALGNPKYNLMASSKLRRFIYELKMEIGTSHENLLS